MMSKKTRTVMTWVIVIVLLLSMISYVVFFINGAPEGAIEIEEATTPAQEQPQ